ncbi:MAG: DUF1800 domain-containing protein [Acidobacteriota bacterium]|nr:DUF1800 domain-containing protein [Acidobacteriota bacterium]
MVAEHNVQHNPTTARTPGAVLARSLCDFLCQGGQSKRSQPANHLYWQHQIERQHATGNFRDLMKAMGRNPAMLRWLDSNENTKASPNENYARELIGSLYARL